MTPPLPPFKLVPTHISDNTVEALEELLKEARKGDLIGIAFAAMYRQRAFNVDAAGETMRNRAWTRGMVLDLLDSFRVI